MGDPYDFELVRKTPPAAPDPFLCIGCDRLIKPDPWQMAWREKPKPPLCAYCEGHWSHRKTRPSGITRGDLRNLRRLDAAINRLIWETYNGPCVSQ